VTVNYAWIFTQSVDGGLVPPGGISTWLDSGTVLGNLDIDLLTPGETSHDGVFNLTVTSEGGGYFPFGGGTPETESKRVIGSGYIWQASTGTYLPALLCTFAPSDAVSPYCALLIPGVPDLTPPDTSAANLARLDWPWTWAEGDKLYSGTFTYPLVSD